MSSLGRQLGQNTFGFLFVSRDDREPLVIFPGDSYLETIERMGLTWNEILEAGGWNESVRVPCNILPKSDDCSDLAHLLSQIFVAGMLVERDLPRRYATQSSIEDYRDPYAP